MNKFFQGLLALALLPAAEAQTAATRATPAAPTAATPSQPARRTGIPTDNQLLQSGSFELPRVKARSPKSDGGDFLLFAKHEWTRFSGEDGDEHGKMTAGLTNEIARTGRQSLYLEFNHVTKPQAMLELASEPLAIKPGEIYRVSIWGRVDPKRPLTIEQRLPSLRLKLDFTRPDRVTPTGEQVLRTQPMPGSPNRPAYFVTDRWTEFFVEVKSPDDAGFIRFNWNWITPSEKGETNGVIFFDDATLIGPRPEPPKPLSPTAFFPGTGAPGASTPPAAPPGLKLPTPDELRGRTGLAPVQDPSPTPITPPAAPQRHQ